MTSGRHFRSGRELAAWDRLDHDSIRPAKAAARRNWPKVEIHYRWHPLPGRRVRRFYSEQRVGGQFVHIEASPGVIIVVAAWMLDRAACAGMQIGAPRVAASALLDLNHRLIERGFRAGSSDDRRTSGRSRMHDTQKLIVPLSAPRAAPRQLSIAFGSIPVQGMRHEA